MLKKTHSWGIERDIEVIACEIFVQVDRIINVQAFKSFQFTKLGKSSTEDGAKDISTSLLGLVATP